MIFTKTVDSILGNITKQICALEDLAAKKVDRAEQSKILANAHLQVVSDHLAEADRARKVSFKLRDLIS